MRPTIYPRWRTEQADKNLNHHKLSALSDTHPDRYRAIRTGDVDPTDEEKARLARALNVPVAELFARRDPQPPVGQLVFRSAH